MIIFSLLVNLAIGVGFFAVGIVFIKFPLFLGHAFDHSAVATLSGAMFGAGAVFIGNQINSWFATNIKNTDLKKRQDNLRELLIEELIQIMTTHMQHVKDFESYIQLNLQQPNSRMPFDQEIHVPQPTLFQAVTTELLILPKKELSCLVTLYENLSKSRRFVENCKNRSNLPMTGVVASNLKNSFIYDCEIAAETIEAIKPNRSIKLTDGTVVSLATLLRDPIKFK